MRRAAARVEPAASADLSPGGALVALLIIERSLDAFCRTASRAVADLGGREALLAASEMTCIGPIPRLREDAWEAIAAEHADAHQDMARKSWRS